MPARIPFDFTTAIRRVCQDVAGRLPEFAHVRMEQVGVTFAQARRRVPHGLQARLTPLRFEGGALTTVRQGRVYAIERWHDGDRELLYVLTFYLPRFLDQPFHEKLVTVLHELYHIGPAFDGDIRRWQGRCHVHSRSQKEYDRRMERLAARYLEAGPPESLLAFLRGGYRELAERHGGVVGVRMPLPKLLPLPRSA